jgi:hypothetical protein
LRPVNSGPASRRGLPGARRWSGWLAQPNPQPSHGDGVRRERARQLCLEHLQSPADDERGRPRSVLRSWTGTDRGSGDRRGTTATASGQLRGRFSDGGWAAAAVRPKP